MGVLRKEKTDELTGFYTLVAGLLGVCRHVDVGVSPRDRTRSGPYSVPKGA